MQSDFTGLRNVNQHCLEAYIAFRGFVPQAVWLKDQQLFFILFEFSLLLLFFINGSLSRVGRYSLRVIMFIRNCREFLAFRDFLLDAFIIVLEKLFLESQ